MLVALLELQIKAVTAKFLGVRESGIPATLHGICPNVEYRHRPLLSRLFVNCPSFSGRAIHPVKEAVGATYSSINPVHFWGDHPYADNRRQIIAECIEQLQVELRKRGYHV